MKINNDFECKDCGAIDTFTYILSDEKTLKCLKCGSDKLQKRWFASIHKPKWPGQA